MTLRNALAHAKPRIVHNYLTTEEDRRSLIEGVRLARESAQGPRAVVRGESAVPASTSELT